MQITEIAWGVAFAAPVFKATAGWVMLQFDPPNFVAAKTLFTIVPLAPLVATGLWAYKEHPSVGECLGVAIIVGATTMILTLELLRWLKLHEKRDS
jgi:hypothetical protein